ncbi:MAG: Sec-independent protein translocase protein TatB [Pseudohongiellaceae bacterium]
MFNVGPFELLIIFVVALLVIGPERLPGAVKTGGLWIGRFRRSFHKIKAEIEQELNADEIRRQLHNESILEEVENVKRTHKELGDEMSEAVSLASEMGRKAGEAAKEVEAGIIQADVDTKKDTDAKDKLS